MVKLVRGLSRGLEILQAINEQQYISVSELASKTSLPRTTAYRLASTLVAQGYARRSRYGDNYSITNKVLELSAGYDLAARAAEQSRPFINQLSKRIKWPVLVLGVANGTVTTLSVSESQLSYENLREGVKVPLLRTAVGQLHLANLGKEELRNSLQRLRVKDLRNTRMLIDAARKRGFGARDKSFIVGTCSIAVAVRFKGRPLIYLAGVFFRKVCPLDNAIKLYLQELLAEASRIEDHLKDLENG